MNRLKITLSVGALTVVLGACSSVEIVEPMPKLPEVPTYAHVAHPQGYDLTDIKLMFYSKMAPKPQDMKSCDAEMLQLRSLTTSIDEVAQGARELVIKDPVKYHWCFYSKLIEVHESLKDTDVYWSEKQKRVMEAYLAIVPIARAFKQEYGDVRYLRAANRHYRQMSQWVFYRKVELTPEGTQELMDDVANPFSLWKKNDVAADGSVLEKYGIARTEPNPMGLPMPEERAPAALPVPEGVAPVQPAASTSLTAEPTRAPASVEPVPAPSSAPVAPLTPTLAPTSITQPQANEPVSTPVAPLSAALPSPAAPAAGEIVPTPSVVTPAAPAPDVPASP